MITIGNIKSIRVEDYDAVYAIVRSMKRKMQGVEQLAVLSPSSELFGKYLDAKRRGDWNSTFWSLVYVPEFIAQMDSREARDALNKLYIADKRGLNIALVCFCDDELKCHRSIVAGLLQGVGCNVRAKHDYSVYYRDFLAYVNQ